ncbi:diaminobutyrate aminotransferase [Paenibacillus cellulosilyticus]|uniref:Diaminobutyrate--2-oxoglutarate transaminase n=1 Tax=Paenibacillus cellulosilyticus TaxID=375489 RepID=A0A2V2Z0S6_9BACL|nr:diaminobutyrate--2-oxoglutarate transaminase [Paenibacillus cellulosilyticus]PWW00780.1 diaminobutyrate aminotransferase [Paenibacillus cellulosilyticus]QKS45635.1 diaminobutyrate--2-oxoglutarate transaminase [Paenibacillus cellulosilyticus]
MEALMFKKPGMNIIEELESEVRSYCRSFPTIFTQAYNYILRNIDGREYIDFFAGAGALNYGHNNPKLKKKLIDYMMNDGITHSLDMATSAKANFLAQFNEVILKPRGLKYKVMFPGPTGSNSVESALKLARKVKNRKTIMSFTNAFHGMTLGSLAVTGNKFKRDGAGVPLEHTVFVPFDNYYGDEVDTVDYIAKLLNDKGSGISVPAAIILETVQGEGGINVADYDWLRRIAELCQRQDILLIVDDVQAGCGRTGTFFSFEEAGIEPDIVCLSKSIGGYGLPMAITLIKPELDIWKPGEHNGTFRGNNLAFITAAEALTYWENDELSTSVNSHGRTVRLFLEDLARKYPEMKGEVRGRGLMQGIAFGTDGLADQVCRVAFELGLIMETSGADKEVVKIMPPLTIDNEGLMRGLRILADSVEACSNN